jgi:hypothetical protein
MDLPRQNRPRTFVIFRLPQNAVNSRTQKVSCTNVDLGENQSAKGCSDKSGLTFMHAILQQQKVNGAIFPRKWGAHNAV